MTTKKANEIDQESHKLFRLINTLKADGNITAAGYDLLRTETDTLEDNLRANTLGQDPKYHYLNEAIDGLHLLAEAGFHLERLKDRSLDYLSTPHSDVNSETLKPLAEKVKNFTYALIDDIVRDAVQAEIHIPNEDSVEIPKVVPSTPKNRIPGKLIPEEYQGFSTSLLSTIETINALPELSPTTVKETNKQFHNITNALYSLREEQRDILVTEQNYDPQVTLFNGYTRTLNRLAKTAEQLVSFYKRHEELDGLEGDERSIREQIGRVIPKEDLFGVVTELTTYMKSIGKDAKETARSLYDKVYTSPELNLTVKNKHGIHARPASFISALAVGYTEEITVTHDDETVNAKSITSMLTFAAGQGSQVTFKGPQEFLDQIQELASLNFGDGHEPEVITKFLTKHTKY